jgi:hypothetical protein
MSPRQQILTGFLLGIFTAFMISFIVFVGTNPGFTFVDYFDVYVNGKLLAPILSVALVGNLGLFFLFLKLDKDAISRGVLLSTMVTGVFIFILKFFLT